MSTTATMNIAGIDVAEMLKIGRPVVIASWWPAKKVVERRFKTKTDGGFFTAYTIPACDPEAKEPVLLIIGDAIERQYLGQKRFAETPVPGGARDIAKDIITNTRDSCFGIAEGRRPGIWICAGDQPTAEEKVRWKAEQDAYFRALVAFADDAHFNGRKEEIGTLHKMAAEWLRLDPRKHVWVRAAQRGEIKLCQFCRTQIDAEAVKCEKCGEVVDPARYAEMKKAAKEAVEYLHAHAPDLIEPPKPTPGRPVNPPVK